MTDRDTPKRWLPIVIDFSPSEQLTGDPARVITMGFVIGLAGPTAVDRVGVDSELPVQAFTLHKWKGRAYTYKKGLLSHLHELVLAGSIAFGRYHAEEHVIRQAGKAYLDAILEDELGDAKHQVGPIDQNKNGRERVKIGISDIGKPDSLVEIKLLLDEIYIFGWITEAIVELSNTLSHALGDNVGLHVMIDRLPLDSGTDNPIKGHFLGLMAERLCGNRVKMYTHEIGAENTRDLLADNVAGLASEVFGRPSSTIATMLEHYAPPILSIERTLVTPSKFSGNGK